MARIQIAVAGNGTATRLELSHGFGHRLGHSWEVKWEYSMCRTECNLEMGRSSGKQSWTHWAVLLACAIPAVQRPSSSHAEAPAEDALIIHRSRTTGRATFVTAGDGKAIWTSSGVTPPADRPMSFLRERGHLFGIAEPARELVWQRVTTDRHGQHTTYEQVFHGVPVFAGVIKVHQNSKSEVVAANGDFFPIKPQFDTTPGIAQDEAVTISADAVDCGDMIVEKAKLVIVDPGWYGDPPIGEHLAYYIVLQGTDAIVREAFFVDAKTGRILDQWSLTEGARFRASYDGDRTIGLPGINPRFEGDPPVVLPIEQNYAYDWAGDVYRYFFNAFGYDGIDGAGMNIVLTVSHWRPDFFCPNAFWNGSQSVFCDGTVTDDVLAHEIGHGVTEFTADLIYQNQSGQLNESYSDVWGEMVDLFNGDAAYFGPPGDPNPWPTSPSSSVDTDAPNWKRTGCPGTGDPSVRWLIAEDAAAFGGFIRDMWDPTCSFVPDPPSATHNLYLRTCSATDNGGVHSGSGVPNHAFAMLVDGKSYAGFTITAIGPIKTAAIWFRALTVYLTPASDFLDAYWALNQSALDLVGTFPFDPRSGEVMTFPVMQFTQDDAAQVDKALRAVAMDVEGLCGETTDVLDPSPPDLCDPRQMIYAVTFDLGAPGWTVFNSSPRTEYDWELVGDLPFGRPGTAFFCADLDSTCSSNESGTHTLMSPGILLPARMDRPILQFSHYMASEVGWDGGVLRISVNDGPFSLVPPATISFNRYNMTLLAGVSTNPLAGLPAWSGSGGQWGTTVVDLATLVSPGDTVQFQFQFGKDRCTGVDGWYVDDVFISTCICGSDAHCTDGEFCNGEETCVDGFCQRGVDPCLFGFCDEEEDFCDLIAFFDDFEPGSPHDWELGGPDDTANAGAWFIGIPNGTIVNEEQAQPDSAYQGILCAFTALNESAGGGDVDGGAVYLTSPAIDLTGAPGAELSYVRWFYNRSIGAESDDWFRVDASDDDGVTWTNLETIHFDDPLANTWTPQTVRLDAAIDLGDTVKIRFGASDGPNRNNIIEAAVDNVQVLVVGECESDADCDDGDVCTIDTCSAVVCHYAPITCLTITGGFPASGSIDARQPHPVDDAAQVAGWNEVAVFHQGFGSLLPGDFTLTEVGGDGVAPVVVAVTPFEPTVTGLTFSEPIEPGAWTVVTHDPTGWQTCLGFLPADVNGDGLASSSDIGVLIDAINGILPTALPDHALDIDRSGVTSRQDILRLIDLLNGASEFDVWHSKSLPENPCN